MANPYDQIPPNQDEHVLEYVDAYCHDVLSPADARAVAAHCESCAICRAALDEARKRQEIVQSLPPVEASEALIQSTLTRIGRHRGMRRRWAIGGLAAAASLLVAIGLAIAYYPRPRLLAKADSPAAPPAFPHGTEIAFPDDTPTVYPNQRVWDALTRGRKEKKVEQPTADLDSAIGLVVRGTPSGPPAKPGASAASGTPPPAGGLGGSGYLSTQFGSFDPTSTRAPTADSRLGDNAHGSARQALSPADAQAGSNSVAVGLSSAPEPADGAGDRSGRGELTPPQGSGDRAMGNLELDPAARPAPATHPGRGGSGYGFGAAGGAGGQVGGYEASISTHRVLRGTPGSTALPQGQGYGPAEISLSKDPPGGTVVGRVEARFHNILTPTPYTVSDVPPTGAPVVASSSPAAILGHKPARVETWKASSLVANSSRLMIGDEEELPLRGMQADVRIDGFRARVLLDCYYFNDRPRQLEGTFQLRLPSGASPFFFAFGQTVYRAALSKPGQPVFFEPARVRQEEIQPDDILAFRRDTWEQPKAARMVQKEKAAYAYRETVRRRVDPALMEWSGAGVFNCRIFPLAPQRLHRVVIGYDLDLVRAGDDLELRMDMPDTQAPCVVDLSVAAEAAERVTLAATAEKSSDGNRVFYRLADPKAQRIAVRIHEPAPVMLSGVDPKTGPYFAARFRPELPAAERPAGSPNAVFLVDASLSSRPQQFGVWLELLRAVLENNRDSVKRFAVLFFNVDAFWWQERFVDNTPENVEALLNYADGLTVEGATDLGRALSEAASPNWLAKAGEKPQRDFFLLSDGAPTWGQGDWSALAGIVQSAGAGPLFAYNTGFAGTEGRLLAQLAARSGGAVFSVVGTEEIAKAATAHRWRPWRIVGVKVQGGSDLLLAGRPQFIFPQQELLLVGRGVPEAEGAEIQLSLERGGITKTVETKIGRVLPSQLAARTYGEVAVGQLEELAPATDEFAPAYARHFRVPGQTCSLLMLDTEQDYARFHIDPQEDAYVVKGKAVSEIVAQLLDSLGKGLGDPKAACLAWLDKLPQMAGLQIQLPEALRLAMKQMPPSAFVVTTAPLACKSRTRKDLPRGVQDLLASGRADYDAITAEAQRRLEAMGPDDALRALSSLVEEQPGDLVVSRDVAFSAMAWGLPGQAYHLLHRAVLARPYEPQTYQQLAQCLEAMGRADLALVYYELAYGGAWDMRFGDFHKIVALDYLRFLRRVAAGKIEMAAADFARDRLATIAAGQDLKKADLLVTIAWNTDGTDVDLHVTGPDGEECFYGHTTTRAGGQITRDVTQGLGPEMYVQANAPPGPYRIQAHYFASDANRASARTKVYATIYEGWGTPQERVWRKALSLVHNRDVHDLATIVVGEAPGPLGGRGKEKKGDEAVDPYLDRP